MPAVDHRRPFGVLVVEQEEVVSNQLHLVERVIDRHRLGRVFFGANDPPRLPLDDGTVVIVCLGWSGVEAVLRRWHHRGRLGQRNRGFVAVVHLAAILTAAQPALQFDDR
ncbi:Uncharacterised protein [Mycobacterium tuberculosis]|nr:Uncharacterised protein [Mycobacterium tuberculosis]